MGLKRKFESDDSAAPSNTKQLKLVPFPHIEIDNDVAMSEVEYEQPYHTRLPSTASTLSTSSDYSSDSENSVYPAFNLYPLPFFESNGNASGYHFGSAGSSNPPSPSQESVGLFQPKASPTFTHHGINCTQIPKLRIACSAGPNGNRTMWTHCEQCGAIEMVAS